MPKALLALALLTACSAPAGSAEELPTGTWKIVTKWGSRERNTIVKLEVVNGKLAGTMMHHLGHRTPVENAEFKDGKLSFETTSSRRGTEYTTKYVGTMTEGVLRGTIPYRRGGRSFTVPWEGRRTSDQEVSTTIPTPPAEADVDLSEENLETWRDHILPEKTEMAWSEIPWLSTLKDGILAANTEKKPVLLWTMNGHPLGCT